MICFGSDSSGIFAPTNPLGPVHVPTLLCLGRSAENSSSRSDLPRKRKQPWKVRLGPRSWGDVAWIHSGSLMLPLFLCSVEAPPKPTRTSDPQPRSKKKTKALQTYRTLNIRARSHSSSTRRFQGEPGLEACFRGLWRNCCSFSLLTDSSTLTAY